MRAAYNGDHRQRNMNNEGFEWVEKMEVNLTGKGTMEDFAGCRKWRSQPQE